MLSNSIPMIFFLKKKPSILIKILIKINIIRVETNNPQVDSII
jgi:hypothetical protein